VSLQDVLDRREAYLHTTRIVDGSYLRYLSSGNWEGGFELRQRQQCVVKCTVNVRNMNINCPVRPSDIPLIGRSTGPARTQEKLILISLGCRRRPV
jgi:hypothetical protein